MLEIYYVKGKAFPLQPVQACSGIRKVKASGFFHDFRHYEGGKVVTLTHRPFLPPGVS
jgi:hypothetical protein